MAKTFIALTILTAILWLGGPLLEKMPLGHLPGDLSLQLGAVNISLPFASVALVALIFYISYKIYLKLSK